MINKDKQDSILFYSFLSLNEKAESKTKTCFNVDLLFCYCFVSCYCFVLVLLLYFSDNLYLASSARSRLLEFSSLQIKTNAFTRKPENPVEYKIVWQHYFGYTITTSLTCLKLYIKNRLVGIVYFVTTIAKPCDFLVDVLFFKICKQKFLYLSRF